MPQPIKNILIIEDDRFIGEMYARSLINEGYTVDWVLTGNQGYDAALTQKYDLILLDIMLPETQGDSVLSALRGDQGDKIPNCKVIVLTNFEQDEESRMAMEKHADGYLIKAEITPRKLIEIIKEL